jgi:pre-rRNA-processing protein TSR2
MDDIFNVDLEDGSEREVAALIMRIRQEVKQGNFSRVDAMWEVFSSRSRNKQSLRIDAQSDSGESVDDESEGDVEMDDAPTAAPKSKPEPQVDGDGFTVVQKRRR